jgi:hypothetical protein
MSEQPTRAAAAQEAALKIGRMLEAGAIWADDVAEIILGVLDSEAARVRLEEARWWWELVALVAWNDEIRLKMHDRLAELEKARGK